MKTKIPVFRADDVLFLTPKDKRYKKYKNQIKRRGFSNSELWNLDYSIYCFILPRLKRFRETLTGYPGNLTMKQWKAALDKMIRALESVIVDSAFVATDEKTKEGLDLLFKYINHLWN